MKSSFVTRQDLAENTARRLIYAWTEYGIPPTAFIEPAKMPNDTLAKVADAVAWAASEKIHGFANILAEAFEGAPEHIQAAFKECCDGTYPATPNHCRPLVDALREFYREKRQREIADKIRQAIEVGDEVDEMLGELHKLKAEAEAGCDTLRERAYSLRYDPNEPPPPDELCMSLGDFPISARGNLSVIQGKSKVGKTAVVSAVLGAAQRGPYQASGDTLCMEWNGDATGAIIHLDTEQSRADWHSLVGRSVTRSGIASVSPRLVSLPLVMFSRSERLEILRQSMKHEKETRGRVDVVIIDGIADLCASPNDEKESLELVSQLHALAQSFECAIFCILHENPSGDKGTGRGHLGSELNRKAFANLRIDKDTGTSVSTIWGSDMRKRDIPRDQGFCFAWNLEAGMHTFQGRAAGLKAALRDAAAAAGAREFFGKIFRNGDAIGKYGPFPMLTAGEAAEVYRETIGNGKAIKPEAMKKRMQKAESLGVLGKTNRNEWRFIPSGTSGNHRENSNSSRP